MAHFEKDSEIMNFLFDRCFLLRKRIKKTEQKVSKTSGTEIEKMKAVATAKPANLLEAEINALHPKQLLLEKGEFQIWHAKNPAIPHLIQELGRLREISFREVGEGTGEERDIDAFDQYYTQLFIWNKEKRELVGAYRLGQSDKIIAEKGIAGMYTSILFKFQAEFFEKLGPAMELGRAFVRSEYQNSPLAIMLLWKGIGSLIVKNPECYQLFGAVSITNEYNPASRQLIVKYIEGNRYLPELAKHIKSRTPFKKKRKNRIRGKHKNFICSDIQTVSEIVMELEPDQKGVPGLIKQYMNMGGNFLGFNIDHDFCDVLDGLTLVDLRKTDPRILSRFLGKEGTKSFLEYHKLQKENN
jgi:putative hemolysin